MASSVELEPAPAITGTRPGRFLDADFHHPHMFLMAEGGRFAGGAAGHQAMAALLDLPGDEFAEGLLVHLAVPHRGDQGGNGALDARRDAGHGQFRP